MEPEPAGVDRVPTPGAPTWSWSPPAGGRVLAGSEVSARERDDLLGLRRGLLLGWLGFAAFIVADVLVDAYVQPGALGPLACVRGGVLLGLVPPLVRLYRAPPPSARLRRFIDTFSFAWVAAGIGAMAVVFGGFESPYLPGVLLVLILRAALIAEPWRRAMPPVLLTWAAPTLVLLGASAGSPALRAQLSDPGSLAIFGLHLCFFTGAAAFSLLGGNTIWAIRSQLFSARSVGRYRLDRRLGEGAMGEVWLAADTAMKRSVALKFLRPERSEAVSLERFEREARATAMLRHPNTVRVFDYGRTVDGLFYYAMEVLTGGTLAARVRADGALGATEALAILGAAADALAEAHAHGIVHRDIKPENIFLEAPPVAPSGVKLLDFGMAHAGEALGEPTLTATGWIGGTPAYMAPEAIRGERAGPAADVYGLGAVLYFMLTGGPPFDHQNLGALLAAHLSEDVVPPSHKAAGIVPLAVEALCLDCLRRDPSERPSDARAVIGRLRTLDAGPHATDRSQP